jgi:hypothetical protein
MYRAGPNSVWKKSGQAEVLPTDFDGQREDIPFLLGLLVYFGNISSRR